MLASRALVLAASLLVGVPAFGQVVPFIGQQEAKLIPSDAAWNDSFGNSVALSDDTALVGAMGDDNAGGIDAGSAYVLVRSGTTWTQQAKLTASNAAEGDRFGHSVAVSGDTVVIGAYGSGNSAGSAYVFVRSGTTWTQEAMLTAPDASANDYFGLSVAVSGDTAVVGSPFDDAGTFGMGQDQGSAYVFTRSGTTWSQQAKLTASAATAEDNQDFGWDVSVSVDTIVVGALYGNAGGVSDAGAAYVFARSETTWSQQAKLTASDAASFDAFGQSVAVSENTALIGSIFNDHDGLDAAGSAYVFVRDGAIWAEQAKLTASDAAASDYFGTSVDLVGDDAVVGAKLHDFGGTYDAGSASVFIRTGASWSEQTALMASDAAPSNDLGISVAIEGATVLVGADEGDAGTLADAGSAYIFRLVTIGDWADLGHGLAGTAGVPALTGTGYLLASSPITLSLSQAKPFSFAPLVIGITAINAPFKGGVMVPNPDLVFPLFSDFFGSASFGGLWPPGIPSAFTIYFQWWIADPTGPQGFAASNALAATTP